MSDLARFVNSPCHCSPCLTHGALVRGREIVFRRLFSSAALLAGGVVGLKLPVAWQDKESNGTFHPREFTLPPVGWVSC